MYNDRNGSFSVAVPGVSRLQEELQRLALYPCRVVAQRVAGRVPEDREAGHDDGGIVVEFGLSAEPLQHLRPDEWLDVGRDPAGAEWLVRALRAAGGQVARGWQIATAPAPV